MLAIQSKSSQHDTHVDLQNRLYGNIRISNPPTDWRIFGSSILTSFSESVFLTFYKIFKLKKITSFFCLWCHWDYYFVNKLNLVLTLHCSHMIAQLGTTNCVCVFFVPKPWIQSKKLRFPINTRVTHVCCAKFLHPTYKLHMQFMILLDVCQRRHSNTVFF